MSLRIDEIAPNFRAVTTHGEIDFYEWAGDSWVIFLSHPADFTPVCTTEFGKIARIVKEFEKRNVKPIGLSVDPIESHFAWIKDIETTQGVKMNFPMISDTSRKVAVKYNMIHPFDLVNTTIRSLFIIDPNKRIRLTFTYPVTVGRNLNEVLRAIDALQLADKYDVATPADWQPGDDVVIAPNVADEDIPQKFPKGHKRLLSYLRTTPQPDQD